MMSFAKAPSVALHPSPAALARPRLSPLKWNRGPIAAQVGISAVIAIGFILCAFWIAPDISRIAKQQLGLVLHEIGHAVGAYLQGGEVQQIRLRADGSGEAVTRVADPVLGAGMGLVFPATLAAACIVLGVMRMGVEVTLLVLALPLVWLGYANADILTVRYALWGWAFFAVFFAVPGVPHTLKSAALMVVGLVLTAAIYDGAGYLWVQYVPDAAASAPPAVLPSDVRIIADAFGADGIEGARAVILLLFGMIALMALCLAARFLAIHPAR